MPGWGLTGPLKTWVAWGWQLLGLHRHHAAVGLSRLADGDALQDRLARSCRLGDHGARRARRAGIPSAHRQRTVHRSRHARSPGRDDGAGDSRLHGQRQRMGRHGLSKKFSAHPTRLTAVYPCAGEDNWIIIACASDEEWQSMVEFNRQISWAADAKFAGQSGPQRASCRA